MTATVGSILARPGLEQLRDQAAAGAIDRLYMLDPGSSLTQICISSVDSRRTHSVRCRGHLSAQPHRPRSRGGPAASGPRHDRRIQACQDHGALPKGQATRCTPGARSTCSAAHAPYGYRYVGKHSEGEGEARYQVVAEEARVVRKIFAWGRPGTVLHRRSVPTAPTLTASPRGTGKPAWDRSTIWLMLKNPAYKGTAAFSKTRAGELKPRSAPASARPSRNSSRAAGLTDRYITVRPNSHSSSWIGE